MSTRRATSPPGPGWALVKPPRLEKLVASAVRAVTDRRLSRPPGQADRRGRRAGGAQGRYEARVRGLLVRVRQRDQPRLAPRPAHEGQPDRKPEGPAGRHRD